MKVSCAHKFISSVDEGFMSTYHLYPSTLYNNVVTWLLHLVNSSSIFSLHEVMFCLLLLA